MAKNLTSHEKPFHVSDYNITDLGSGINPLIHIAVHGYWSYNSIDVSVRPSYTEKKIWMFDISHASGGRDHDEVPEDSEAAHYFGLALLEAAKIAGDLRKRIPELEAARVAYREECAVRREAERKAEAEAAAKRAAEDLPMTVEEVDRIMNLKLPFYTPYRSVEVYEMGAEFARLYIVKRCRNGSLRFYYNGVAVARAAFRKLLLNASLRSALPQETTT